MVAQSHFFYFVSSSVLIFSFLITILYLWHNFKAGLIEKIIGLIFFCITYVYWIEFLFLFKLIIKLPHFFRTGALASSIFIPLMYLVVLKSISEKNFKWFDALHIIPFVVYVVNFIPFFFKSSGFKKEFLMQFTSLKDLYIPNEGWLITGNFIVYIRIVQIFVYFFGILYLLNKFNAEFRIRKKERKTSIAFASFLGFFSLISFTFKMNLFEKNNEEIALITYMAITLLFFIFFLLNPVILFNYDFLIKDFNSQNRSMETGNTADGNTNIEPLHKKTTLTVSDVYQNSEKEILRLVKIEQYLEEFKPYLKQDFSVKNLEQSIGISSKLISKSILLKYQINFNQYINILRINYVLQMLNSDSNWRNYNNAAIAENTGFNTLGSFYSYFKEHTGNTPVDYIKKLETQILSNLK